MRSFLVGLKTPHVNDKLLILVSGHELGLDEGNVKVKITLGVFLDFKVEPVSELSDSGLFSAPRCSVFQLELVHRMFVGKNMEYGKYMGSIRERQRLW